eukprot:775282-Prorocentrum_minimum.AAC.1
METSATFSGGVHKGARVRRHAQGKQGGRPDPTAFGHVTSIMMRSQLAGRNLTTLTPTVRRAYTMAEGGCACCGRGGAVATGGGGARLQQEEGGRGCNRRKGAHTRARHESGDAPVAFGGRLLSAVAAREAALGERGPLCG